MMIRRQLNSVIVRLIVVYLIIFGGLIYSTRTALQLRDLIISAERVVGAMYRVTDYNKEIIVTEQRLGDIVEEWEDAINDANVALIALVNDPAINLIGENLREQILYTQRVWDVARFRFISARQQLGVLKTDNTLTPFQKTGLDTMLRTVEDQENELLIDRVSRLITTLRSFDRDGKTLIVGTQVRVVQAIELQVNIITRAAFTIVGVVAAILSVFSLIYVLEKARRVKTEYLIKRMEVYTMKARMNPHFLYNTLSNGVQLAIVEDAERTAAFMDNLVSFFRHNTETEALIVPLRHEIEGLRLYIEILKVRFQDSLTVYSDIDNELLDGCSVPTLILQPIVENSVIHAFSNVSREREIRIRVFRSGHYVHLSVSDNGNGMPRQTAEELLRRNTRHVDLGSCSRVLGFENVIQRLYFFFPENREIVHIESAADQGTTVLIKLDTREKPCIPSS